MEDITTLDKKEEYILEPKDYLLIKAIQESVGKQDKEAVKRLKEELYDEFLN